MDPVRGRGRFFLFGSPKNLKIIDYYFNFADHGHDRDLPLTGWIKF